MSTGSSAGRSVRSSRRGRSVRGSRSLAGGLEALALPSLGGRGLLLGRLEDVQLSRLVLLRRGYGGHGRSYISDGRGVFADGGGGDDKRSRFEGLRGGSGRDRRFGRGERVLVFTRSVDDFDGGRRVFSGSRGGGGGTGGGTFAAGEAGAAGGAECRERGVRRRGGRGGFGRSTGRFCGGHVYLCCWLRAPAKGLAARVVDASRSSKISLNSGNSPAKSVIHRGRAT